MNKHIYYRIILCIIFYNFCSLNGYSQNSDCINKYKSYKNSPLSEVEDLNFHLDMLDSLLRYCKHEDKKWIDQTLKKAFADNDSLVNHSFPWTYYVYLYKRSKRANDATELLDLLIHYSEKNGFKLSGDFYIERGLKYGYASNYALQLNAYQKGLNAYKRDNSKNVIYALGVIGLFHLDLGDLERAKKFKLEALDSINKLQQEIGNKYIFSNTCKDLGLIYLKQDSLIKSENYYEMSLEAAKQQENDNLTISVYDDNINFYLKIKKYDIAEQLLKEADNIILKNKTNKTWTLQPQYLSYHDLTISKFGMETNNPSFLIDPKLITTKGMSNEILKEYFKFSIEYANLKGQTKNAFDYSQRLNKLISEEIDKQKHSVTDLVLEKETNARLQEENINLIQSEKRKTNLQYLYLGLSGLLGISLLFFYYFLKKYKQYNRKLEDKQKRIEAHFKELERVTYVMTHDLKEPINTVKSFTELLLKKHIAGLDKKAKSYFDIIYNSSNTMLRSVNSLHNHLLLGNTSKVKWTNLESAWESAQINLKATILKLKAEIKSDRLPKLNCYEDEIITLFQSLLSNSLKYAKKGIRPIIYLSCTESHKYYTFSFSDNGIGIDPDHIDGIFELFQRVHEDKSIEGSGIGLANVRKIIDYHKGEIWVESKLHHGSTFYFTIPKDLE